MKKKTIRHPTKSKISVLNQLCNLIPPHLVPRLAREHGVDDQWRTFSPWSHTVTMMFTQVAHSVGLNDVCDALDLHRGPLSAIRGATPPSRNNLSHANQIRDAQMAEQLFWSMLEHLQNLSPSFARGREGTGALRRFRRTIHAVDSTTIELIASCLDWARHRRRKAAAKCHLRLNLQTFLPNCAIIDTARENDAKRAREMCAGILRGEIVVFDKAYVDYDHLGDMDRRGVFWVTRAKKNLAAKVVKHLKVPPVSKVLQDEIVDLEKPSALAPKQMRRITAMVEVDGREQKMVFLTSNLDWRPTTITDLYRCRWEIESFFKEIKQNLQLADFFGNSANAVRWQIWTALLAYLLIRFQACQSRWQHGFTRLFTLIRAAMWQKLDLLALLHDYGTACSPPRTLATPHQAYLPGFA